MSNFIIVRDLNRVSSGGSVALLKDVGRGGGIRLEVPVPTQNLKHTIGILQISAFAKLFELQT